MQDISSFRIWDKVEKKYLICNDPDYVDYAITPNGTIILIAEDYSYCRHIYLDKNWYIIEKCTGLKDKNGKLIFEGDIVEVTNLTKTYSLKTPVIWEANIGAFMVWGNKEKTYGNYIGALMEKDEDGIVPYTVEVIGNIHENPELLEK